MVYAAFAFWFFLVVFAGLGVYRLWRQVVRPKWVNGVLLPGTLASEMGYILGSLITGGEIRRARLFGGGRGGSEAEPATEAAPRFRFLGPMVASMLAVVTCAGGIVAAHELLGEPVIVKFILADGLFTPLSLPKELPGTWDGLWRQVELQVKLLRRMAETLGRLDWLDWRSVLFVYLAACLSVRLAPVGRDLRPTLAAVAVLAGIFAAVAAITSSYTDLMARIWYLLTYIWANLLFLLAVTGLVRGLAALVGVLAGKKRRSSPR